MEAKSSDSGKKGMKMQEPKKYKHLPHIDIKGSYQFITFRTKESLDAYLKSLYRSNDVEKIKQYKMDQYLDSSQNGALYMEIFCKKLKHTILVMIKRFLN